MEIHRSSYNDNSAQYFTILLDDIGRLKWITEHERDSSGLYFELSICIYVDKYSSYF